MKDYKMINEAITTAEDLLKTTKQNYENSVCNKEWDIKFQICDYIYNQLKKAEFPNNINIRLESLGLSYNCYDIYFSSGDYGCDRKNFKYQLFIRNYNGKVSRIFFNEQEYHESEEDYIVESTLLCLIQGWSQLKEQLIPSIDKAYQQRINQIKQEANEIKRKQDILESFEL